MSRLILLLGAVLFSAGTPSRLLADCGTPPVAGPSLDSILLDLSAASAPRLTGSVPDRAFVTQELDRISGRIRPEVAGVADPEEVVDAMNRVVFGQEKFSYDARAGAPENYLLDRVLRNRRGNCLGMTVLYLSLAERLGIPLKGVYVPSHCFARLSDGGARVNIEFADNGASWEDARYERLFRLSRDRPYLRSLERNEMIGVYLKTLGAACGRRAMDAEARRLYGEAARRYPGLPDTHYNAAVLATREGREDEAIAGYRRTLDLDPGHAPARNNLGAALARKGLLEDALREAAAAVDLAPGDLVARANLARIFVSSGKTAEGIREFNRVLDVDGNNAGALAGLVRAYFIRGDYDDARAWCDRAAQAGCRIDPALRKVLEEGRVPRRERAP